MQIVATGAATMSQSKNILTAEQFLAQGTEPAAVFSIAHFHERVIKSSETGEIIRKPNADNLEIAQTCRSIAAKMIGIIKKQGRKTNAR